MNYKHYEENYKLINANNIYNKNDIKICSKCKLSKSITEYKIDKTKSSGLWACCKLCEFIEKI